MSQGRLKHRCRHVTPIRVSRAEVIGMAIGSLVSHGADKVPGSTRPSAMDAMLAHPMALHIWVVIFVAVAVALKTLPRVSVRNATLNIRIVVR